MDRIGRGVFALPERRRINCGGKSNITRYFDGRDGGTYYPLGATLAQAISEKGEGISATAQSGNASVANCNLIARGDVETAFVQNNVADDAYNGRREFEGHAVTNLRAIAALYPETIQVVARKAADVKNLSEVKGKIIAVGDKGSGTEVDTRNFSRCITSPTTTSNPFTSISA